MRCAAQSPHRAFYASCTQSDSLPCRLLLNEGLQSGSATAKKCLQQGSVAGKFVGRHTDAALVVHPEEA